MYITDNKTSHTYHASIIMICMGKISTGYFFSYIKKQHTPDITCAMTVAMQLLQLPYSYIL